jgi:hypothetical protein
MTRSKKTRRWASRAGFLAGLAAAAFALSGWQIPAGSGTLGLDVQVLANSTGELGLEPAGVVLNARHLDERNASAEARTTVTNQTSAELAVRMRALPESHDLDALVRVEALAGDHAIFRGPLSGLRAWTAPLRVAPNDAFEMKLRLTLVPGARGYRGRMEDIGLEFRSRAVATEAKR